MIRVETKNCPGCNKSEAVKEVSPEIDPLQNTPLLEKYWRGFYKDKILFVTMTFYDRKLPFYGHFLSDFFELCAIIIVLFKSDNS